jgi:hypothetical protein
MRITSVFLLLVLATTNLTLTHAAQQVSNQALKESTSMPGYQPADGFVPDSATAIAVAVAVWEPVYGKKNIAEEAPYQATLKDGRWTVTGTLPKGAVGGVATAVIEKMTGRIIKMYHTK